MIKTTIYGVLSMQQAEFQSQDFTILLQVVLIDTLQGISIIMPLYISEELRLRAVEYLAQSHPANW